MAWADESKPDSMTNEGRELAGFGSKSTCCDCVLFEAKKKLIALLSDCVGLASRSQTVGLHARLEEHEEEKDWKNTEIGIEMVCGEIAFEVLE